MYCKNSWGRPALLVALLLCGASLAVHRTQAAPSANLDQTRNGEFDVATGGITVGTDDNGNAGFQNSHYLEGHGIPYRCVMSDLPANTTITIRLGFDIKHSNRNALDYLTGYQLLDPHTQFGHLCEVVDPLVGLSGSAPSPFTELTIDTPKATVPAASFAALPTQTLRDASKRKMSLWGGTLNSITYVDNSASWNSKLGDAQSQIQIDVTFKTGSGSVAVLAWAGHIASRKDWGFDANGVPNSAGGIDDSPYHMALISWTLSNIGQQDRSLKANAVIIPPTCDVTGDTKCVGQTAALTVTPHTQVGGFGIPYTFAWSKTLNADGSLGAVISTLQTLSIPNVQTTDQGTFYAKVFDKNGISSLACNGQLTITPNPVAAAGPNQVVCEDKPGPGHTFSIDGTAQNGTPAWTIVSKSPTDLGVIIGSADKEDTTVNLSKVGTVTLRLTVTSSNPACGSTSSDVTLTVNANPLANAGPDQAVCEDAPGPGGPGPGHTFTVNGTASNGTIAWTVLSKSPSDLNVTIGSPSTAVTTVGFNKPGQARLILTVTSIAVPQCNPPATDDAILTVNDVTIAPLANAVACSTDSAKVSASFSALAANVYNGIAKNNQNFGFGWFLVSGGGSQELKNGDPGVGIISDPVKGTSVLALNTGPAGMKLAAGTYTIRVLASDATTGCAVATTANLAVAAPAIACGDDCVTADAALVIHPLDADAAGGAAIVHMDSIILDTFPSGTDISYEALDRSATLSLGPGQVTTTQIDVPICNKGNVPLQNVKITFYAGTANPQTPSDCTTVPGGTAFSGTLAPGDNVVLRCTVSVQCGTVPITVSGDTSADNGACTVQSNCSVPIECVEVFCRTTGGGRQDPGPTTHLQTKSGNTLVDDTSVNFTTHGGQLRGRQNCPSATDISNFINGRPDICGQWQHVRHASNGRLQSFHTAGIFDSLRCACLACDSLTPLPDAGLCNPGDRVCGPEPRRANANAIAVTGVGKMALKPGQKDTDVVFRIYVEDRGEPGGSPFGHPEDPPDVYCLQIWIVNPPTSANLRAAIACKLGTAVPAGAPVPDFSDCGDLSRGNHQLHPVKNLNCP